MIRIEGELRNVLQKVCDYDWSLCETSDGGRVCFSDEIGSFGYPNDKLLELILTSEFPVYLRVDSRDSQNVELRVCKHPSEIKWMYTPGKYIVCYDENGIIHSVTGVGIYLGEKETASERITFTPNGITIPSLGKFISEQYMNSHETVDKKFVQAIINWKI